MNNAQVSNWLSTALVIEIEKKANMQIFWSYKKLTDIKTDR